MFKNKAILFLHLLVWAILFASPYFYSAKEFLTPRFLWVAYWIPYFFYAALFYLNFFVFIKKFLYKRKILKYVFYNVLMIVLLLFLMTQVKEYFSDPKWPSFPGFKKWVLARSILSFLITLAIVIAARMTEFWILTDRQKKDIENQYLKTELTLLRYQVQPHFFFNSLNNIYSMIDIDPESAKETVHGLAKLMRYLLYETSIEKVELSKEIEFLKNFISLMKIRLSEKVKIDTYFDSYVANIKIEPLLFLPLVENAFKHGVSALHKTEILIDLRVEGNILIFIVQNHYYPKREKDRGGSGVGLDNLYQRLWKLYPGKFDLSQQLHNQLYTTTLKLTL